MAQADRTLHGNMVVAKLKAAVSDFKSTLPVIVNLRCTALKRRHWSQIHKLLGYEIKVCTLCPAVAAYPCRLLC